MAPIKIHKTPLHAFPIIPSTVSAMAKYESQQRMAIPPIQKHPFSSFRIKKMSSKGGIRHQIIAITMSSNNKIHASLEFPDLSKRNAPTLWPTKQRRN